MHEALLVRVGVGLLVGLVALVGEGHIGLMQVRDPRSSPGTPVHSVPTWEALHARTPDDVVVAALWDKPYLQKLVETTGHVGFHADGPLIPPASPGAPLPDQWIGRVCGAEIVIIGHAVSERVFLNKSETFLITVSEVPVDRWLMPNAGAHTLTVAAEGGQVKVGERLLTADVNGQTRDFRRPWLLFLKKVPGTTMFGLYDSPVPLGETLLEQRPASRATSPWKAAEARVARVAATCAAKR